MLPTPDSSVLSTCKPAFTHPKMDFKSVSVDHAMLSTHLETLSFALKPNVNAAICNCSNEP